MQQTEILTQATHVNGWKPAVYMSYLSQNFRLLLVSNLSVRNFQFFLLMYPGSLTASAVADGRTSRPQSETAQDTVFSPPPPGGWSARLPPRAGGGGRLAMASGGSQATAAGVVRGEQHTPGHYQTQSPPLQTKSGHDACRAAFQNRRSVQALCIMAN